MKDFLALRVKLGLQHIKPKEFVQMIIRVLGKVSNITKDEFLKVFSDGSPDTVQNLSELFDRLDID